LLSSSDNAGAATETSMERADHAVSRAEAAAASSGVKIALLDGPAQMASAAALAGRVWQSPDCSPADASLLQALSHAGNFVAGAFSGAELVGLSFGFFTSGPPVRLHSHMTCTSQTRRNTGLGYALKLYQRGWALRLGVEAITWTCDPLVRSNAMFNLVKLGAEVAEYLPNFYGAMTDGLNAGDESDRLMMHWDLTGRGDGSDEQRSVRSTSFRADDGNVLLESTAGGAPRRRSSSARQVGVQVPDDIVGLRTADPVLALRWRHELRDTMLDALGSGYRVVGFARSGYYLLRREELPPAPATAMG
jgi:predicted GNAT superfamily acetyltransferase